MSSRSTHCLGLTDFGEAFGAGADEVAAHCGVLIEALDFHHTVCSQLHREQIFLDILQKCDRNAFSASGQSRQADWSAGWGEILAEFLASGGDLETLTPKDIRPNRPLRYRQDYIIPRSPSFERQFFDVFRHWLYKKYFAEYETVYEFGCGTGHNLALLATLFPDKTYFGLDWAPESQSLLDAIARTHGWRLEGRFFDFFHPDAGLDIRPGSVVYTSAALEQTGTSWRRFMDYLGTKRPALCVHVECILDYYDENTLFDYVAIRYHQARNYLAGFLGYIRELERAGQAEILATRRLGFGSLYHEVFSYVIWRWR